jgi:ferredoxin
LPRAPDSYGLALSLMSELSPKNKIHIEVDRALCIGSGDCVDTAPDVFQLDAEEKAVVVDPDGAPVDDVIEAAGNCPVSAIFVVGESGDLYP